MNAALEIRNLQVTIEDTPILKGVNLTIKQGEVHALMGPNGSGKSTLANVLLGNPAYVVTAGEILFDGQDLLELEADARSRAGLFLAFQYPVSIPRCDTGKLFTTCHQRPHESRKPRKQGDFYP